MLWFNHFKFIITEGFCITKWWEIVHFNLFSEITNPHNSKDKLEAKEKQHEFFPSLFMNYDHSSSFYLWLGGRLTI